MKAGIVSNMISESKEVYSNILIALHNACVLLKKEHAKLCEEENFNKAHVIGDNIDTLESLSQNINNIEKAIVEELVKYFNDELYNEGWDSVKTWIDSKGKLKVLKQHEYDLSIKILKSIKDALIEKHLKDFKIEDNLIY